MVADLLLGSFLGGELAGLLINRAHHLFFSGRVLIRASAEWHIELHTQRAELRPSPSVVNELFKFPVKCMTRITGDALTSDKI